MADEAEVSRAFDKKLYVLAAIEDALAAYADFASMTLDKGGDAWTVAFTGVDEELEPDILANEFSNYVLAGTIERKR